MPFPADRGEEPWVLWGSELSPYALKVEALLRYAGLPFHWLPASGPPARARRMEARRRALMAGRRKLTWPVPSRLDEFPQVPFLFGPQGEDLYDSSAIGAWLGSPGRHRLPRAITLLPEQDPALRLAIRLADEAFDEVGLYLVHYNRWVVAARENDAGARLAREMRPLLGPFASLVRWFFPRRQVRRLPYLFSVAEDSSPWADLPRGLRPPTRAGFPPTHALLDQAFDELLAAIEPVLAQRPFLFGDAFSLADASLYGQLGMNRKDPAAWREIVRRAPATAAWVDRVAVGEFGTSQETGSLSIDSSTAPLLAWIGRVFLPLLQQNEAAWRHHGSPSARQANEAAFDRGRCLYDGLLLGKPFRSVVKTFQVRVWQDLRTEWAVLDGGSRTRLAAWLPLESNLGGEGPATTASRNGRP